MIPLVFTLLFLTIVSPTLYAAETTLINRNALSAISGEATRPVVSADGNIVVFQSQASDLVSPGIDTNDAVDVFAYDRNTGFIEIISINNSGEPGNASSSLASVSANGRYIAFVSTSDNLGAINLPSIPNIFVRDRLTNLTSVVNNSLTGAAVNASSITPSISADGRYVAYVSSASNLVVDDTNGVLDIFVYDRTTGTTRRVSVDSNNGQADSFSSMPSISADGRYIAFRSAATNLVDEDTNNIDDVFRHDTLTGDTLAVSARTVPVGPQGGIAILQNVIGNGASSDPSISDDGQFVAFVTQATSLHSQVPGTQQVVIKNMASPTAQLTLVSRNTAGDAANDDAWGASMSRDARYVFYASRATNLVDDDTNNSFDYFLFDSDINLTERVSVADDNTQGDFASGSFSLTNFGRRVSDGGQYIVFDSVLNGLVTDDSNSEKDVFLRDRGQECEPGLAGTTLALPSVTWLLASLPCSPPSSLNTVGDILADDIPGGLGSTWAVFTYDTTAPVPAYVSATLDTELKSGLGFWIQHNLNSSVTLDMPAGSRQVTGRRTSPASACVTSSGCFELPLSGAPNSTFLWNMIGNPFAGNNLVAFNDLRVTTAAGTCAANDGCTMGEAAPAGANVVNNSFFHFDGTGYVTREAGSLLSPWEGYWVPELPNAEFNSPLIRFPR